MARLGDHENVKSKSMQKRLMEMRTPIIEKCIGCKKIDSEDKSKADAQTFCSAYINPEKKWSTGDCPMATHLEKEVTVKTKVRVGQQKQKKNK